MNTKSSDDSPSFGGDEANTPLPVSQPADGWDDVEAMLFAKDDATKDERSRCEAIVLGELDRGRLRGVPETSGVMRILHRIAAAIANG
jgi:hypothetical protein